MVTEFPSDLPEIDEKSRYTGMGKIDYRRKGDGWEAVVVVKKIVSIKPTDGGHRQGRED